MTVPPLPVDLKNPVIAGVLAFLCPGAGHFYQKRFFKAFVFAIGIWGDVVGRHGDVGLEGPPGSED